MRWPNSKTLFLLSLFLLDAAGLLLAFQGAFATRFGAPWFLTTFPATKGFPSATLYTRSLLTFLPVWLLVFFYMNFYKENPLSAYDELIRVIKGVILCSLLTTTLTFTIRRAEYSRLVIGLWCIYSVGLIYLMREMDKFLFLRLLSRAMGRQRILVIGKGRIAQAIRKLSAHQSFLRVYIWESLPVDHVLVQFARRKRIRVILLIQGMLPTNALLRTARLCEEHALECRIIPDLLEMRRGEIVIDGFLGLPTFSIKSLSLHGTNYYVKRGFDIMASLFVMTVLFLPLLFVCLFIRLETPGPIFYSHERMGFHRRTFKLYKFRTMTRDADAHMEQLKGFSDRTGPVFKMRDDPRVTRIGRWLRRFSIDEFPQLVNVLKGDMSLVGPRPQVLWEAAHYDDHSQKRLRLLPGITGLWQVSGRAALSFEEMIDLDIFYLENWSLGLDLKILLRTLPAVFTQHGAY